MSFRVHAGFTDLTRVLHVASGDLWGGAEAMLLDLTLAQRSLGGDVRAILLNEGLLAQRLRDGGIPVTVLPETAYGAAALTNRIRTECLRFRPDVLHTHRIKENVLGAVAARSAGVPVCVRTAHGDSEHALHWYQARKQVARVAERLLVYGLVDATAAVSEELAQKLKARHLAGAVQVVENGLDPVRIRLAAGATGRSGRCAPDEAVRIGFFGRLVPVKRIDLFIDACAALAQRVERRVHAYIVGEGPLRTTLESRADLHPSLEFTFTGFVDNPATVLTRMDALVITSDHEGLPMTMLEALALGVPVVSRAVGGIPQVLQQSSLGFLVDTDRPEAISAALAEALARADTAVNPSKDDDFPSAYTATSMARRYEQFYRSAAR